MKTLLKTTLYGSLSIQIVTLFFDLYALTKTVVPTYAIIQTLLQIEIVVQMIEFAFYVWYTYHFHSVSQATFYRYFDWMFTTPLMLFTTIIFYDYQSKPEEEKKSMTVTDFVKDNWKDILKIGVFNGFMLLFGYLYETKIISLMMSTVLGFIAFFGSFYTMYDSFASKTPLNTSLYTFMISVWSLYGVAATFSPALKNISYNILDIIAKNFYGIFLGYLVITNASA
jgi:bacteriorhodopsin